MNTQEIATKILTGYIAASDRFVELRHGEHIPEPFEQVLDAALDLLGVPAEHWPELDTETGYPEGFDPDKSDKPPEGWFCRDWLFDYDEHGDTAAEQAAWIVSEALKVRDD